MITVTPQLIKHFSCYFNICLLKVNMSILAAFLPLLLNYLLENFQGERLLGKR